MSTVIRGEVIRDGVTANFAVHDSNGPWTISVSVGDFNNECDTDESHIWPALMQLIGHAIAAVRRKRAMPR